jgi:hypothetical protein
VVLRRIARKDGEALRRCAQVASTVPDFLPTPCLAELWKVAGAECCDPGNG